MKYSLGRHLYGLATVAFGICAFVFHDIVTLHQVKTLVGPPREAIIYMIATVEILAGIALQWPRSVRTGAVTAGAIYLIFALLGLPYIVTHPLVYNAYGNFFEQFSLCCVAAILYAGPDENETPFRPKLARVAYYAFGVCVLSFGLEQFFYLAATASLVPRWIPPGQTFWAVAITAAFALAAVALLSGIKAVLAARLTTAMLGGFLLLVWVPALLADARSFENWSEAVETLAIAASVWIVAQFAARRGAKITMLVGLK